MLRRLASALFQQGPVHTKARWLHLSGSQRASAALAGAAITPKGVAVRWPDGTEKMFNAHWLRHNCRCPACIEPNNGQRILPVRTVQGAEVQLSSATVVDAGLCVEWGSGHTSVFPLEFLERYAPQPLARLAARSRELRPTRAETLMELDTSSILVSDAALSLWLDQLTEAGACLLTNAGKDQSLVVRLAERISTAQATIYGTTFDVISQPQPINLAYSPIGLELHQDLAYYESMPGLQFLHCVRFDEHVTGGESTLCDMIVAAERLREIDPDAFDALTRIPACFWKVHYRREVPVHITYQRPIIAINRHREIVTVSWSPPFEAPLQEVTEEETVQFYDAYVKFAKIMQDFTISLRLRPGQVLTFNNRRMSHGREKFELPPDGERHLVGVYVHIDEFRSRQRVLAHTLRNSSVMLPRVGNGDVQ